MQKKHALIIGIVGTLLFSFLIFLGTDICYINTTCKTLRNSLSDSFIVTLFFPCVLAFSLITYKMYDEVFRTWLHFSYWWIPLSFLTVLFSSSNKPANIIGISNQSFFSVLTLGLYIVISIVIISWKYFATRHK